MSICVAGENATSCNGGVAMENAIATLLGLSVYCICIIKTMFRVYTERVKADAPERDKLSTGRL